MDILILTLSVISLVALVPILIATVGRRWFFREIKWKEIEQSDTPESQQMGNETKRVAHPDLVSGGQTALHKHKLNACDAPDGAVDFNQQEVTSLVIEKRTDDPSTPVDGQIWLRSDFQGVFIWSLQLRGN